MLHSNLKLDIVQKTSCYTFNSACTVLQLQKVNLHQKGCWQPFNQSNEVCYSNLEVGIVRETMHCFLWGKSIAIEINLM